MRIAILDPAAGISGDMILGALVDAGVDPGWLQGLPARVGFPDVGVRIARVQRSGVAAAKVSFEMPATAHDGHGRTVGALVEIVRRAQASAPVRERAARAFELIGEAEGRVHGVAPERVHLHEAGAVDAVLDIVGAVEGFERLGVDAVYHLPVAVGSGWVDTEHGRLPVPAPATQLLLEGIEVALGGPARGEATTPTGAALLRVLSEGPPPDRWRAVGTGWGAGDRDEADYPNALRLIVAEAAGEAGTVEVLVTDVDDLPPEYVEPLRQALFDAGAVDCAVWPTQGKKGRVSLRVEVVAPPASAAAVQDALFRHSTTAGVRVWRTSRSTLARQRFEVELGGGVRVGIKVREGSFGRRLKAEYDDVVEAARRLRRPALEVAREAERLAERALEGGTRPDMGVSEQGANG